MGGGIDRGRKRGTEQNAPRKVALVANCLLNQNAKVCQGAHYPGLVSPVVEALRKRGYVLQQLPCPELDRKSTRLNSSHLVISYAVFCLKKKTVRSFPDIISL